MGYETHVTRPKYTIAAYKPGQQVQDIISGKLHVHGAHDDASTASSSTSWDGPSFTEVMNICKFEAREDEGINLQGANNYRDYIVSQLLECLATCVHHASIFGTKSHKFRLHVSVESRILTDKLETHVRRILREQKNLHWHGRVLWPKLEEEPQVRVRGSM